MTIHARWFAIPVLVSVLLFSGGCARSQGGTMNKGVVVLGIDGMDPAFLDRHWDVLPNLDRLRREGEFKKLETTMPPQSPVAWSTFITGMDPTGHGLFDFVHRDPKTLAPYLSMSQTIGSTRTISMGSYELPLSTGSVISMRQGKAFWQILSEHHIPTDIIRMPTDFPPVHCDDGFSLAGMGTPDMRGGYGTFAFYTDEDSQQTRNVAGGKFIHVDLANHSATVQIEGPDNSLRKDKAPTFVDMTVHVDPVNNAARFDIGGHQLILKQGEWSDWIEVEFPLIPHLKNASGMLRIYAKSLHPHLQIYVSPVNIDPADPELPITEPASYSKKLVQDVGLFYTQGMAQDTAAYRQGAFDRQDYIAQSRQVSLEHLKLLRHGLDHFRGGLLFFHFFGIDQDSHMLWGKYDDDLLNTYKMVDETIGWVRQKIGDATLVVMSDHGFSTFDRAVHLNRWLMQEGFLVLDDPKNVGDEELFPHVDWSKTKAYSIGLNAVYLNLQGREREGIVAPGAEAEAVLKSLSEKMLAARDPQNGKQMIGGVSLPHVEMQGAIHDRAPDLIVGYMPAYRSSWQTALGAVPAALVDDNTDAWRADHCIDARFVPGVLISNRKSQAADPHLYDLTVSLLDQFGVGPGTGMIGHSIY